MPKTKTFSYFREEPPEDVFFNLNGVRIDCVPGISGMTLLEFAIKSSRGEDGEAGAEAAVAAKEFLQAAIKPESWAAFLAACEIPQAMVGAEQLGEIAEWLSEVYAGGYPTDSSSTPSSGSATTGDSSPAELSTTGVST